MKYALADKYGNTLAQYQVGTDLQYDLLAVDEIVFGYKNTTIVLVTEDEVEATIEAARVQLIARNKPGALNRLNRLELKTLEALSAHSSKPHKVIAYKKKELS